MSRKHYVAVAEDIRFRYLARERDDAERDAIKQVAEDLAATFKRFNGRFDRERFLAACGIA